MYKIIKTEKLAEMIYLMDIEAPWVAKKCEPGQFIIAKIDEKGERIPLTICDYDRSRGVITIVFQAVGVSTEKMAKLKTGDSFSAFTGPLGNAAKFITEDIEKEEGIIFNLLTNPTEILVDDNGDVKGMVCICMQLGEPDASGRKKPVEIPDSVFKIEADTVIMSLGTSPNPLISSTTEGLEVDHRGCIVVNKENGQTSRTAIFAGGDAVTGAATVIFAMEAGKVAAKGINEYFSNK